MFKYLLLIFVIFFINYNNLSYSQQLPNSSFEEWKTDDSKLFEDLPPGFWGTINRLRLLGPQGPITTEKSTDSHSGTYSAKITTKTFGTFKIVGIVATGIFDQKASPPGFVEGMPFTSRPTKLTGYYKFTPVNNDSCSAYINLTKYNTTLNKKDTLGEGMLIIKSPQSNWTKFEVPVNYKSTETPDTIKVAFVSSAGTVGMSSTQNAQVGSSMSIDDLELDYSTEVETDCDINKKSILFYHNFTEKIEIQNKFEHPANLRIFDLYGSKVLDQILISNLSELKFDNFPAGVYFYQLRSADDQSFTGYFLK